MNRVELLLFVLKKKGWTWAAIADELATNRETVSRWSTGKIVPNRPAAVILQLEALLKVKQVPKRKRYLVGARQG